MEQQRQYVGIDLHRRRSVIVRMAEDGQVLGVDQILNDPVELSKAVAKAGPDPEVALESTYGWYWAVDLLQEDGYDVHLVHPLGLHWDTRRVKNDVRATRPSSRTGCGGATCPSPTSPRLNNGSYASWSATGSSSRRCAPRPRPRSTR